MGFSTIFYAFILGHLISSSQTLDLELANELKCRELKKPYKMSPDIDFPKLAGLSKTYYFPLSHRMALVHWATDLTAVPVDLIPESWLDMPCISGDMTTAVISGMNRTGVTYTMSLKTDGSARFVSNVSPYAMWGDGWLLDVITDDSKNGIIVLEGQCWADGMASWAIYSSKTWITQEVEKILKEKVQEYGFDFDKYVFEMRYEECPNAKELLDMRRTNPLKSMKFKVSEKRNEL